MVIWWKQGTLKWKIKTRPRDTYIRIANLVVLKLFWDCWVICLWSSAEVATFVMLSVTNTCNNTLLLIYQYALYYATLPGLRTHHYLIWWMKTYDDRSNTSSYSMSSINTSITWNNSWNILQTFVDCQSLLRQSMAIHQLIKCLNGWEQSLKFHLTDYSNLKIMHLSLFSF